MPQHYGTFGRFHDGDQGEGAFSTGDDWMDSDRGGSVTPALAAMMRKAAAPRGPSWRQLMESPVDPVWARQRDALLKQHDAAGTWGGGNYQEHSRNILATSPTLEAYKAHQAEWDRQHQGGRGVASWMPSGVTKMLDNITKLTGLNDLGGEVGDVMFPTVLNEDVHRAAILSGAGQLAFGGPAAGADAAAGGTTPAAGATSGAAGGEASSLADLYNPFAADDPLGFMLQQAEAAGVPGEIGTAAQMAGYPSVEAYLSAVNPAWAAPGTVSTTIPGSEAPPEPTSRTSDTLRNAATGASLLTTGVALTADGEPAPDPSAELLASEEERQAAIAAATDAVNQAFSGFDDSYYTSIADAYKNFAMPQFTEQASEARRRLPMTVPHRQSSAFNRKAANLETDIARNEADIGRNAIGEANRRRGEIDFTRQELIGLASGGANVESVSQQAASRAQALAAPPEFSPIADLFGKYMDDASAAILTRQRQATPQVTRPLTFSHSPSRSVRNVY